MSVFLPLLLFSFLASPAAPGALPPLHRLAVHLELVAGLGHELVQGLGGHIGVTRVQAGQVLDPDWILLDCCCGDICFLTCGGD